MRPRTRPAAQRGCKTITAAHLGHPLPLVMHEHELVARLEHLGAVGQHHHHAHQHGRRQCPARGCGLVRRRRAARAHPGRPAAAPCGPWRNCARARATVSPSAPVTPPPTLLASTCAARRATAQWPGNEGLYLDNQEELAQAVENGRGNPLAGRARRRARRKDVPGRRKGITKCGVMVDDANFWPAAARASGLGAAPEFQRGTWAPFHTVGLRGLLTRHG